MAILATGDAVRVVAGPYRGTTGWLASTPRDGRAVILWALPRWPSDDYSVSVQARHVRPAVWDADFRGHLEAA